MIRCKEAMDTTQSSKQYKIAHKYYLDGRGIKCSFCPYHRGENGHKLQRSWKKVRKTKWKID